MCFDINQDLKFGPMNFEPSRRLRLRFPIEFTIRTVNKLLLKQKFLGQKLAGSSFGFPFDLTLLCMYIACKLE